MIVFVMTLAALLAVMLLMAVGVIAGGRQLRGSCGGIAGKACGCSVTKRRACERAAAEGRRPEDGHWHLDVLDDDDR